MASSEAIPSRKLYVNLEETQMCWNIAGGSRRSKRLTHQQAIAAPAKAANEGLRIGCVPSSNAFLTKANIHTFRNFALGNGNSFACANVSKVLVDKFAAPLQGILAGHALVEVVEAVSRPFSLLFTSFHTPTYSISRGTRAVCQCI